MKTKRKIELRKVEPDLTKTDLMLHFGTVKAISEALGITTQKIYQWPEVVPGKWPYYIEHITYGVLKAYSGDHSDGVVELCVVGLGSINDVVIDAHTGN